MESVLGDRKRVCGGEAFEKGGFKTESGRMKMARVVNRWQKTR